MYPLYSRTTNYALVPCPEGRVINVLTHKPEKDAAAMQCQIQPPSLIKISAFPPPPHLHISIPMINKAF